MVPINSEEMAYLESTERYRLLDDIVVVGEYPLVGFAVEDLRGIMVSILLSAPPKHGATEDHYSVTL